MSRIVYKKKLSKKEALSRQEERIKIKKMQEQLEKDLKDNGIEFKKQ